MQVGIEAQKKCGQAQKISLDVKIGKAYEGSKREKIGFYEKRKQKVGRVGWSKGLAKRLTVESVGGKNKLPSGKKNTIQ